MQRLRTPIRKRLAASVRLRSPAIAAGLSFLWPGLGQFFLGCRVAAAALAVPALLVAILAFIQLSQGAVLFVVSLWDESYFLAVAVIVIGLGVLRVVAVGHAFLRIRSSTAQRPTRWPWPRVSSA